MQSANHLAAAQIGGALSSANSNVPASPSEVETELNRLANALSTLENAQQQLVGRLASVSSSASPEAARALPVQEVTTCTLSTAIQAARFDVDRITSRINASIELLAI